MALSPSTSPRFRLPELLAPAGSLEKLLTAIHYGADAVYLGGERFSLRARAGNFDEAGLKSAVEQAHGHGVKVYITVNIFAHNRDLTGLEDYLRMLGESQADGLIIADPGILSIAQGCVPELPLHLSTQANVTNAASACFWEGQGLRRLNLARELGIEEIRQIRAATGLELEVFVHGALCISYSGRCLLSSYLTGRNANLGDCAQPCRYSYALVEEKRPGQFFPVEEDERGTYIFNSRDLCLLRRLPELVAAGVDAVKIEGRMKSAGYVGAVVRLYRLALDWIAGQMACGIAAGDCILPEAFLREVHKTGTRGYTENFFSANPSGKDMLYNTAMRGDQPCAPAAIVRLPDPLLVEIRHQVRCGDWLEYLGPSLENPRVRVIGMRKEDDVSVQVAHPGALVFLQTDPPLPAVKRYAILWKQNKKL